MNVRTLCLVMLAGMLCAAAPSAFAQQENGGNRQRGNFNPEEFRAQMETRMKERLAVNDDEWKVIQPKMEKVTNAQRDARGGGGFGGGGGRRGGDGGGDANRGGTDRPQSAVSKASADLRTVLDNKDASADEINAKLAALREARAKAKTELEAAQKELKEVLTARQEAVFVSMGTLE
jgi:Spy/CpxP family protein refolding chaperone